MQMISATFCSYDEGLPNLGLVVVVALGLRLGFGSDMFSALSYSMY
jgi:hypothetical protein